MGLTAAGVIMSDMEIDQSAEATLRVKSSIQEMMESEESPLFLLLQGLSFDFKIKLWKKLTDIIFSLTGLDKRGLQRMIKRTGIVLTPLLLLESASLDLKLGVKQENHDKLKSSFETIGGPLAMLLMPFAALLQMPGEEVPEEDRHST